MKILFFGLGSIGIRHAGIIRELFPDASIYAMRSGKGVVSPFPNVKEIHSRKEVEAVEPDVAFITNPTNLHIETALFCADRNIPVFLEKPIDRNIAGLDRLLEKVQHRKLPVYVAYVLRFHPVIQYVKENIPVEPGDVVSVSCHSYYPHWRKGGDYLASYSSFDSRGGGVLFELSHEFDYIEYLFGSISHIEGVAGKKYEVTVDADDYADLRIDTSIVSGIHLSLDIGSPVDERFVTIRKRNGDVLKGDLLSSTVFKNGDVIEEFEFEANDMYRNQLDYFFSNLKSATMMNNLAQASILFRKIHSFKESMV